MAGYRLAIRSAAAEAIRHLPPDVKRAVRSALRALAADPAFGERLHAELEGLWKYRVRRFRLVYRVDRKSKLIDVVAVGERRGIYEEVAELLRENE
jgi:mRNA interferase RelE/StbE